MNTVFGFRKTLAAIFIFQFCGAYTYAVYKTLIDLLTKLDIFF